MAVSFGRMEAVGNSAVCACTFFLIDSPSGPRISLIVLRTICCVRDVSLYESAPKKLLGKCAQWRGAVDLPVERVAYDGPYHGCDSHPETES